MQRAQKCMLQIMLILLVTSIEADGRRDISRHLEEFKCKLEESIQCYKDDEATTDSQKHRIFHSKDHNLGVNNFIKRCQSKNCHFNQEKMLSLITIISNENGDIGDLDSFAKKFVHTVLKYVDHKVDYVSLDNLFITIETIPSSYLNDFDSLQSTIGKIKKVLHRSKELINRSFFKIAIAACKEVAFEQVTSFLSRLINGLIFLHEAPTYEHIKNEINVVVKTSPCLIKSYYIDNYKKSKSAWNFGGKDSVYNTIEREIIELEQTLGVRYFSKKPNLFFEFFVNYVFKRDQMPIDQCKIDFKDLVLLENQKRDNNRILENLLFDTCNDMITHFQEKPKFEGSRVESTSVKNAYFDSLSSDETFIKRLEKYFEGCKCNEIEKTIEEKYKSERIESFRVLPVENITRIIFDKSINIKTMFPLCRILKEEGILERPHEYCLIYINSEFIERYYDYKIVVKNNKKRIIDMQGDPDSVKIATESAAKNPSVRPIGSDATCSTHVMPMPKSDPTQYSIDKLQPRTQGKDVSERTLIAIDEYDKLAIDDNLFWLITGLENKCIDSENNRVLRKIQVTVINDFGNSHVFIVLRSNKVSEQKQLLLIYNVQCAGTEGNCKHFGYPKRGVYCFNNAPGSFLDSTLFALQFTLSNPCDRFEIPNLWRSNDIDYVFDERTSSTKECFFTASLARYVRSKFGLSYIDQKLFAFLYIEKYIKNTDKVLNTEITNINGFTRHIGMKEEQMHRILCRFVMKKEPNFHTKCSVPFTQTSVQRRLIYLWLTSHSNSGTRLHLCEMREITYTSFLSMNFPRLLRRCIDIEMKLEVPQDCEEAWNELRAFKAIEDLSPDAKLATLIIMDICTFIMPYEKNYHAFDVGLDKERYLHEAADRIGKIIYDNLQRGAVKGTHSCQNINLFLISFKVALNALVVKMVDAVLDEFRKHVYKQFVNLTIIALNEDTNQDITNPNKNAEQKYYYHHYKDIENLEIEICAFDDA